MPCRGKEEGVIPGLSLCLKLGSTFRYLVKRHTLTGQNTEVELKTTFLWVWELPHQTLPGQQSGRCPHPTHRENVVHCLRAGINACWRIMVHILVPFPFCHSLQLCNCETQHTADTQTIPILIICCPEAIYKHQWLVLPVALQLPGAAHQLSLQVIPNRNTPKR